MKDTSDYKEVMNSTKGFKGLRFGGERTNEKAFKRLNDCLQIYGLIIERMMTGYF